MPLTNNFTDSTSSATVHAAHHNELANHALGGVAQAGSLLSGRVFWLRPIAGALGNPATIAATPVAVGFSVPALTITSLSVNITSATGGFTLEMYLYGNVANNPSGILASTSLANSLGTGVKTATLGTPLTLTDRTDMWLVLRSAPSAGIFLTTVQSSALVNSVADNITQVINGTGLLRSYTTITAGTTMPTDLTSYAWTNGGNHPLVAVTIG